MFSGTTGILGFSLDIYIFIAIALDEKMQVGNDQEKAKTEREIFSKNRGGQN